MEAQHDHHGRFTRQRSRPWVIAHRGASARFPENTLASVHGAVESGADAIELDVQYSADHVLMVCHDRTLERYGLGQRRVRDCAARELQTLDLGSWFHKDFAGEPMPTLAQVVDPSRTSIPLMLELKVRDEVEPRRTRFLEQFVVETESAREAREMFVLCFDLDVLIQIHSIDEKLPCILNVEHAWPLPSDELRQHAWLFGVDSKITALTREVAASVHQAGGVCLAYACDAKEDFRHAMDCELDGIISDDPERMLDWVLADEAS